MEFSFLYTSSVAQGASYKKSDLYTELFVVGVFKERAGLLKDFHVF
jgi:hypothetical protein